MKVVKEFLKLNVKKAQLRLEGERSKIIFGRQISKCKKSQLRLEGDARGRADKVDKGGKRDRTSSRENQVSHIFDPTDPGDDIFHLVFYFLCKVENNNVCF